MGQVVIQTNKLHTLQKEPQHLHPAQAKSAFLWTWMLQFKLLVGAWSRCILSQHFRLLQVLLTYLDEILNQL